MEAGNSARSVADISHVSNCYGLGPDEPDGGSRRHTRLIQTRMSEMSNRRVSGSGSEGRDLTVQSAVRPQI